MSDPCKDCGSLRDPGHVNDRDCMVALMEDLRLALLQIREVWDLLESMPPGPGEGQVSTPEEAKAMIEWANRYRAAKAQYANTRDDATQQLIERERRSNAEVRCDCGVPGCNRLYDHRKGGNGWFA